MALFLQVGVLKRTTLATLPPTLLITLKRFELDFYTMQTTKMDHRVEFPIDLNMMPYSTDYINKDRTSENKEDGGEDHAI